MISEPFLYQNEDQNTKCSVCFIDFENSDDDIIFTKEVKDVKKREKKKSFERMDIDVLSSDADDKKLNCHSSDDDVNDLWQNNVKIHNSVNS